ncbi:hypothetical protein JCM5353_002796 [Sporobolomyces roseus]
MNPLSPKESSTTDNRHSGDGALSTPTSSHSSLANPAESPLPLATAYIEQQSTTDTPRPLPNHPLPPNSNQSSLQTSTESPKPPSSLDRDGTREQGRWVKGAKFESREGNMQDSMNEPFNRLILVAIHPVTSLDLISSPASPSPRDKHRLITRFFQLSPLFPVQRPV